MLEVVSQFLTPHNALIIISSLVLLILAQIYLLDLQHKKDSAEQSKKTGRVNLSVQLDKAKVVDKVPCGEIESIAEFKDGKLVMCRCWRSKNFPYCDGSHNNHNKETGDNVGPLIIEK